MAEWIPGTWDHFYSPQTKNYPLLVSSSHSHYRVHSFHYANPYLNGDEYHHRAWISVPDAVSRGIKDGDLIHIYNDIGEMIVPAYVTSRLVPGHMNLPWGGWYVKSTTTSSVMPDGIDIGGAHNTITHNKDIPDTIIGFLPCKGLVQVEKYSGTVTSVPPPALDTTPPTVNTTTTIATSVTSSTTTTSGST